jgi:DNA-directed RNA polymerase subunit E'/Rpb7
MEEVENQLNGLLFKYSDEVGGVPLCFKELQLVKGKEHGRIMAEQPWIHVSVYTKLIIFKPVIGRILNAKVTQVSDNHVSMLIYGMFNASVSGAEMCRKYVFKNISKAWESPQGDISEGDIVQFRIGGFQEANGVLNIDAIEILKLQKFDFDS